MTSPAELQQALHNQLYNAADIQKGVFDLHVHSRIVRSLFATICYRSDWLAAFGLDLEDLPSSASSAAWVVQDESEVAANWSLAEGQKRKRSGRMIQRPGKICAKVFKRYERTYTCKTCAVDQSCVMCVDCFQASNHEGHEVLFAQTYSFAAACDCGDVSAWKDPNHLGCRHHPPLNAGDASPVERPAGFTTDDPRIPRELERAIFFTIVECLEFIITAFQHSPLPSQFGILPKDEKQMRSTGSGAIEGTNESPDQRHDGPWSAVLWADEKHVTKEVTRQIRDALGGSWEEAEATAREIDEVGRKVMITSASPVNAFHVASMFQQVDLGVTLRLAADVYREEVAGVLISWLVDLCSTTVCGDLDFCRRLLMKALLMQRRHKRTFPGTPLCADLHELAYGSSQLHKKPTYTFPSEHIRSATPPTPPPHHEVKRLDWLMQLDARMWKQAKWQLRQLYAGVYCVDWSIRSLLAVHFAGNYVRLFEQHLFQDREIDTNLIHCLSYMVIANGQNCRYAIEHGNLLRSLLDAAIAWYTGQVVKNHLKMPPSMESDDLAKMSTEMAAFRNKKGLAILSHIRHLFRNKEVQRYIVADLASFIRVRDLFSLFVGLQPQMRQIEDHVEYEIEWPKSFAVLGELSRGCREFGESFQQATPSQLLVAMNSVSNHILREMARPPASTSSGMKPEDSLMDEMLDLEGGRPDSSKKPLPVTFEPPREILVGNILVPGSNFVLLYGDVAHIERFSFHNYMHLLLAELLKSVHKVIPFSNGTYQGRDFTRLIEQNVLGTVNTPALEFAKLKLIELPLQKHVVLAQIRADMWKKNGVAMRGQYHHYREISVREATLDQEFFILQFGLCIIDPFKFMAAVIDRFGLNAFFSSDVNLSSIWFNGDADPKQRIVLLEDFVMLLIHLVSETTTINGWTQDQMTRKHIIHQLALTNLTSSELIKKLPERSTERGSIVPIVQEVADFKPPTETASAQYCLKPECFGEVDPYWRYYSRNDQRTVTDKLIVREKKLHPEQHNPVILPKPLQVPPEGQPFSNLAAFLESHVVCGLVHYILAHCMPIADLARWPGLLASKGEAPQLDTLLDLGLQLALIALGRSPRNFAKASVEILKQSGSMSTFQNLWYMQTHDTFLPFRPKINHILEVIVANLPESYTVDYRTQRSAQLQANTAFEDKPDAKQAAAVRQKALMAEFAKKQAAFAALMDEDVDEDAIIEEEPVESFGQCIVCQDDVSAKNPGGMLCLLQPSRILRDSVHDRDWFEEALKTPFCMDNPTRYIRYGQGTENEPLNTDGYPCGSLKFGVYMSACNHVMHESCLMTYFEATKYRHTQQVQRHHPENAVRMEYLCPLCKSIGNVLIPLDTTATSLKPVNASYRNGRPPTLSERIRSVSEEGLMRVSDSARIWDHHVETGELVPWFSDCNFAVHSLDPAYRRQQMRHSYKMVERIRTLIRPLSEQSQRIRVKKTNMYTAEDIVGYTVGVCEVAQRGLARAPNQRTVADQVPDTSLRLIQKLVGLLQLEADLFFGAKYDRTPLRVGLFARFLPDWYRASTLPSPLLLRQPLSIVIEAAAIAPDLLHAVIVMAYYVEVTRVMLGLSLYVKRCFASKIPPKPRSEPPLDPHIANGLEVFANFRPIMQSLLRSAGSLSDTDQVLAMLSDEMLSRLLYVHTLPFLRRATIVYRAVAGSYPVDLPELPEMCEYNRLLALMAIPRPKETLSNASSTETPIVARWLTQWAMQGRIVPVIEFPGTYELCRLPRLWETLVLRYIDKRCDTCGTKPTYPALCLYCGKFLCMGGDCCADGEQGECNNHMRQCGAATGMFVDIKRWVLLYLYAGSGSFGHMPYLDAHGELDPSMRRGQRQSMHVGRFDELRRTAWLQHTIPHLTARRLELVTDGGGWPCL